MAALVFILFYFILFYFVLFCFLWSARGPLSTGLRSSYVVLSLWNLFFFFTVTHAHVTLSLDQLLVVLAVEVVAS